MKAFSPVVPALVVCAMLSAANAQVSGESWPHFARIAGYDIEGTHPDTIAREARLSSVYGIEADAFVVGRYPNLLHPQKSLRSIRALAKAAHRNGNKAFIYIAGTECITPNASKSAHTVVKDHPEWVQRKLTGEPAVFHAGAAIWIAPDDEDVWITPLAPSWRKVYMKRIRQVAATGIDGIYVDVPYWMTHYDGWGKSWASFDEFTVAAFRKKTGLDARKDIQLGNFDDPGFRSWIDFRTDTINEFLGEINQNAKAVNPRIKVIVEIWPGIEGSALRVGADVYSLYPIVDAVSHEYHVDEGPDLSSMRTQLEWFLYQAGMVTFRAFAQGKATWILNYSWDQDKRIDPGEAMMNLAASILVTGANFWDAPGLEMQGSNDMPTRERIFEWIARNQNTLYSPRQPLHPVGVYFSPKSRDYHLKDFLPSYRGVLLALLQAHREFEVITPRTLADFRGDVLIMPDVSVLSESEKQSLRGLATHGTKLIFTEINTSGIPVSEQALLLTPDPGKAYLAALRTDFSTGSRTLPAELLGALSSSQEIELEAPPTVVAHFAMVEGTAHAFIANFSGLGPGTNGAPASVPGIRMRISAGSGTKLVYLPFLGEQRVLEGTMKGDSVEFTLPPVERGAVVWIEK